ncbi:hypothetical protein AB6735_17190 [Mucilaginibacter sp. RCC_168]|uniref:hypothetical protein n=1 Tax=Mucilaginibacter sp. RCC_168 TaxID=3239221 RepID=UPI00352629A5
MKKILLGAFLLVGATTMAHAKAAAKFDNIEITTSCGTVYYIDPSGASTADIINTALELDAADCG